MARAAMNRRNFFASLFAPIVAKFAPKRELTPLKGTGWDLGFYGVPYNRSASPGWEGLERADYPALETTMDAEALFRDTYRDVIPRLFTTFDREYVSIVRRVDPHYLFLRPKVRSAAEKRWRAEYRQQRLAARHV